MSSQQQAGLPPVLAEVFEKNAVMDGDVQVPLHSNMSISDGQFLQHMVEAANAAHTLEVGMAYGISTMFICDALKRRGGKPNHIAIDPFQNTDWRGIGLANVRRAGFESIVDFREARSEFALPALAAEGRTLDFALIDGWHSFDQALVEFFYIDRMLKVGGLVAFDDANWPGISKLMRFLVTLPHYEVFEADQRRPTPTMAGRVRQAVGDSGIGRTLLHPHLRRRTWDLGIHYRCVAFRKLRQDTREMRFFEDF